MTTTRQLADPVHPVSVCIDSSRTRRSVVATMVVAALVLAVPAFVGWRWSAWTGSGGFSLIADLLILPVAVMASLLTSIRLLRQRRRPRRVRLLPRVVQRSIGDLVELSVFGVGPLRRWTAAAAEIDLRLVPTPEPEPADEHVGSIADGAGEWPTGSAAAPSHRRRATRPPRPVSAAGRPAGSAATVPGRVGVASAPPVDAADAPYEGPTVVHTVDRGETWWTLAHTSLGHGRRWRTLAELNRGREVEPGTTLNPNSALRRGWQILLPAPTAKGT